MKVLITGGAGFIGANLCRELLNKHEVLVYDNLSRGIRSYLPAEVNLVVGDILDEDSLTESLQSVDTIVHLAAYGSVVESVNDPVQNFEMNTRGTLHVLNAAKRAGLKKMVFASTGGAIMGNTPPPVSEESLPSPISPYGAGKLCGEAYCHAYAASYEMDIVCLRFANIYGPFSGHKKGVITKFIKQTFTDEPFVIFGDGNSSRDYLHVSDLVAGISSAIDYRSPGCSIFHLASNVETRVTDLAALIMAEAARPDHPIEYHEARPGEVDNNCADYSKAKRLLGFEPSIALKEGIRETYQWYVDNKESVLSMVETDS